MYIVRLNQHSFNNFTKTILTLRHQITGVVDLVPRPLWYHAGRAVETSRYSDRCRAAV